MSCGLQDLSSLTRDRTQAPVVKAQRPDHWTSRESLSWSGFWYLTPVMSVTMSLCSLCYCQCPWVWSLDGTDLGSSRTPARSFTRDRRLSIRWPMVSGCLRSLRLAASDSPCLDPFIPVLLFFLPSLAAGFFFLRSHSVVQGVTLYMLLLTLKEKSLETSVVLGYCACS